jgi:hypothetical protein
MDHAEYTIHFRMLTVSMGMCSHHPAMHCIALFIKNLLPQQLASFRDHYPAIGLHASLWNPKVPYHVGIEVLVAVVIQISIFKDMTIFSVESQLLFWRMSPPSLGSKSKPSMKPA